MKPLHGYMHALPVAVLIILLISIVGGCRHTPDARLAVAEALMDERPDSALTILDSVDPAALRGDADRALYAMLLTMAMTKCHLYPADDSLISIAVDYYRAHDDPKHFAISSYYQGRIYYLCDSMPAALVSYLRAKDIAERHDDPFWAGMACRGIADIYRVVDNYGAQLTYARKQKDYTLRSQTQPYLNYAMTDYACALHNAHNTDSALIVLDQLLGEIDETKDLELYYIILRYKSQFLLSEDNFKESYILLQELWSEGKAQPMDSLNLAWCIYILGQKKQALEMVDTITGDGRPLKQILLAQYYESTGEYIKAIREMDYLDSLMNSKYGLSVSNPLSDSWEAYYDVSRQLEESNKQKLRMRNYLLILITAILLCGFGKWGFTIYRRQKRELELSLIVADNLRQELSIVNIGHQSALAQVADAELKSQKYKVKIDHLQRVLSYTEEKREQISGLVDTIRMAENGMLEKLGTIVNGEGNDIEKTNRKIAKVINGFMQTYSNDMTKITVLEDYANNIHDGIMESFRADIQSARINLKDADYRLFLYSVLDFTIPTVTLMLGETDIRKIYDRRKRLRRKLNTLPEEIRNKHISYL